MKKRAIIVAIVMAFILIVCMANGYAPAFEVATLMATFGLMAWATYALDKKWTNEKQTMRKTHMHYARRYNARKRAA